jgi:UDP-N-acetylmuramoyl-tripeptide--D-alanyl-D-alanine ligase
MTLWRATDAARATGGRTTGDWCVTGVSIDSRNLTRGDLFVALTDVRDGHDFVSAALAAGAGAALVSRIPQGVPRDAPLLIVKDVQTALEDLGRAARARFTGQVVAVTGSVGKTSTKEMLRDVLGGQGKTHAAVASYNNHWGVPLTLARMPPDACFAVIEIGMNHPGEIAPLSKMARPHVAVVTTVAPAHLAAFRDISDIACEKATIFEGLEPNGVAIYNGDLEVSGLLLAGARAQTNRIISFGQRASNHHRATTVRLLDHVTVVTGRAWRTPLLFKLAVPGRHFATNALAVMAVVQVLGLDRAIAATDLGRWTPVAGRGLREIIRLDPVDERQSIELIDDAYNANPASVAAAMDVLASVPIGKGAGHRARGRRIAYLGDMKELGSSEDILHRGLADLPAFAEIDVVHCVGPLMDALYSALPVTKRGRWTETSQAMAADVARDLNVADVVLVKGSLSMGLAQVVDAVRAMGHLRPLQDADHKEA